MQNIDDLDVSGRRVLVRSDLNVPFDKSGSGVMRGRKACSPPTKWRKRALSLPSGRANRFLPVSISMTD